MEQLLNGSDWEAGYFLSTMEYAAWRNRTRNLHNMLMDSARSCGFLEPGGAVGDVMKATVPGSDRTVLLENGLIFEPYFGRNLEQSSWSEKRSWAFRKSFKLDEELKGCRQLRLRFDGIDYACSIFLNGVYIGYHEGMFMPWEGEVTDFVKRDGDNLLALIFEPAPQGLPNHQEKEPAEFAGYHRVQSGFGWDWSRSMVPTGIWDSVRLLGSEDVRIKDLRWSTRGNHASLELEVEALEDVSPDVELSLQPLNFSGAGYSCSCAASFKCGSNKWNYSFDMEDAQMWYPAGYGKPNLYRLEVKTGGNSIVRTVGFRDICMRRNPGSPEGAYDLTFELNGQKIFARGGNWVPVDLLPSRATDTDYENLVRLAGVAKINLFRVWGGGLVEKDGFYEACDRHGILVWQEFPHACSNYRKDAEYLAIKRREGEIIIRKLRNHVSTALFCGGNEVQYYGEIPDSPLYAMYGKLVEELAPEIAFHTSSPDASRPGERPHGPWNYLEHSFWNGHFRQLASELGCNGLPEAESLDKFIPACEPVPHGQSWRYHFATQEGANSLLKPLETFALKEGDRKTWSQASMFAQADATGYMFEHYRRLYPRSSGCIFWQFNEPWPTCGWSLVDYYKVPKMAVYRMGISNAPRMFSLEDESWIIRDGSLAPVLWYCGDTEGFAGTVCVEFFDAEGTLLKKCCVEADVSAGVSRLEELRVDCSGAVGMVLAVIKAVDREGRLVFRGDRVYGAGGFGSAFALPRGQVKTETVFSDGRVAVSVENTGKVPLFALRLKCATPVCWSSNYWNLAPGEKAEFTAEPFEGESFSPNEEVSITAWNL